MRLPLGSAAAVLVLSLWGAGASTAGAQGSWEVFPSPSPGTVGPFANELFALDGVTAGDVWAVGAIDPGPYYNSRATLAMHFDGTSWGVVPTPNPDGSDTGVDVDMASLFDVDAISATDAWAVGSAGSIDYLGSQPVVVHWDGSAWSEVPVPRIGDEFAANDLNAVSAVSSTDVWAVGSYTLYDQEGNNEYGTLLLHWDGATWELVPNPCNATEDVVAISSTDVWAVGSDTCHWDGSAWTPIPNDPSGYSFVWLRSVSAAGPGEVWAVGFTSTPYFEGYIYSGRIERWDGSTWTALAPAETGDRLDGVLALSPTDGWAVGGSDYGLNLVLHWDGSSWTAQDVPSPGNGGYLNGLGEAGTDLWAAGIFFGTDDAGRTLTVRRSGSGQPVPATVTGTVRSRTGQAIAGATVSWTGPQSGSTTTSATGQYQMTSTGGTYSITASAIGCKPKTLSLTLSPGQTVIRNFRLRCG